MIELHLKIYKDGRYSKVFFGKSSKFRLSFLLDISSSASRLHIQKQ